MGMSFTSRSTTGTAPNSRCRQRSSPSRSTSSRAVLRSSWRTAPNCASSPAVRSRRALMDTSFLWPNTSLTSASGPSNTTLPWLMMTLRGQMASMSAV